MFGVGITDWEKYVKIDPAHMRPAEVPFLLGRPIKAKEKLGWKPKTNFKELIEMMVDEDMKRLKSA
jgi:GDPmannose 4,6-dehydratase